MQLGKPQNIFSKCPKNKRLPFSTNSVKDILTLATIDTQIPEALIGRSSVADIVNRVISSEHLFIGQRNLQIVNLVSSSFVIRMNESYCDLLLSNLISNSVKYSKEDGTIRINTEISHDIFALIVQDDGQGIAPEHLHRIFEEFFKVDSSRHDRDSYGLGLTLVLRIVRSYGGTITAESEGIGKGATIRICFPVGMMIHNPE
jgi:signal transduction histidine kinase